MFIQFIHGPVFGLQPVAEGLKGRGFKVVLCGLIHQQPYGMCGMVFVSVHDVFDIDRRVLTHLGIIQAGAVVIEGRLPGPSRGILGAQCCHNLDPGLSRGIVNPVVAREVPMAGSAFHVVPDHKDARECESILVHQSKMPLHALLGFCPVQEEFGADAELSGYRHPGRGRTSKSALGVQSHAGGKDCGSHAKAYA